MTFKGLYQYAETYSLNDVVKITAGGQYICVVETTGAVPGQSSDWQYLGGNINTIDGLGSDENGDMVCNMSVDVSEAVVEPSLAGAASMTLNISSSMTVRLNAFANPLYNTNPAAVLWLVISTAEAGDVPLTVTFTNCDNYWMPDGSYSTDAPIFSLDSSQPMTLVEVRNVTNAAAPGVMVRQVYPVATSENSGDIVVPDLGAPGSTALMGPIFPDGVRYDPGEAVAGGDLGYVALNNSTAGHSVVVLNTFTPAPAGTWSARGYLVGAVDSTYSATDFVRIDGTNLMPATMLLQATSATERVRNCRYATVDNSIINCEVLVKDKWYPFSASPDDRTSWGPAIYAAALTGLFGDIELYR
jgi:hypothetical protein